MLDGIDNLIECLYVSMNLCQIFKKYKKYQVFHEDRDHGVNNDQKRRTDLLHDSTTKTATSICIQNTLCSLFRFSCIYIKNDLKNTSSKSYLVLYSLKYTLITTDKKMHK